MLDAGVVRKTLVPAVLYVGASVCAVLAALHAYDTIGARQDVVRYSTARTCADGRTEDCLLVQSSTISQVQASSSAGNKTTHVYLRLPGIQAVKEAIVDEDVSRSLTPGETVTTTRWNGPTVLIAAGDLRLTTEAGPQNRADKQEVIALGAFLLSVVLLRVLGWRRFGRRVDRARFRRVDLILVPAVLACVSAAYLASAYTAGLWAVVVALVVVGLSSTVIPMLNRPFARRCDADSPVRR